jgi:hypothetical protein
MPGFRNKTLVLSVIISLLGGSVAHAVPGAALKGTEAEKLYFQSRSADNRDALLKQYAAYYSAGSRHPESERRAALYRALDLLALSASATNRDMDPVAQFGGTKLPEPYYVVNYDNFFGDNFSRYSFHAAAHRRAMRGKTIVVAVSKETCNLNSFRFSRKGAMQGRLADYFGGFYNPFKPNGFFKVALTDAQALSDADMNYAVRSCEDENTLTKAFPIFVVHGQIVCDDDQCEDNPQFLINFISYSWTSGNILQFLGNTIGTSTAMKKLAAPLGIQ